MKIRNDFKFKHTRRCFPQGGRVALVDSMGLATFQTMETISPLSSRVVPYQTQIHDMIYFHIEKKACGIQIKGSILSKLQLHGMIYFHNGSKACSNFPFKKMLIQIQIQIHGDITFQEELKEIVWYFLLDRGVLKCFLFENESLNSTLKSCGNMPSW
ncbi:hypothetical protein Lalb_Chr06g0171441 [Lupinus albus]|uniref:Uncharacterized protein n=1 Tax=Lupinus albus TaxID=3870 RepID=A0A6A4QFB1_LUPAL|nr:hypothetical protein Lalb_Chr06g0171441 [Lupinus albus]